MTDQPPRRSLFIGRWQPLHEGHIALIRTALDEGRDVLIGIMETPRSERNPHAVERRMEMFWHRFGDEMMAGRMTLMRMPWIDEVCYGRKCGWGCRHIQLSAELEAINGTALRDGGNE